MTEDSQNNTKVEDKVYEGLLTAILEINLGLSIHKLDEFKIVPDGFEDDDYRELCKSPITY